MVLSKNAPPPAPVSYAAALKKGLKVPPQNYEIRHVMKNSQTRQTTLPLQELLPEEESSDIWSWCGCQNVESNCLEVKNNCKKMTVKSYIYSSRPEVKNNRMKMTNCPKKFSIDAIIVDLSKIESILNADSAEKRRLLMNFKKWTSQRKDTLAQLQKLKKELDDICFQAKVGKLIATGSSIVGTVAAVVGFGFSFSGDPSIRTIGKNLAKWGVGAGAIGGATTAVVSSTVESIVNQRILAEVKNTLYRDFQLTRQLVPYLDKSEAVELLFNQVFDCDITETGEDFFTVVHGITSLYKEGKYAYEEIAEAFSFSVNECSKSLELKKIKKIFQKLGEKVQFVLIEFCRNPKVHRAICKIEQALISTVTDINIASTCLQLTSHMFGGDKSPTMILLQSVKAAMDVVNSITKAKDIVSLESKYSGRVEEIESLLSEELSEANRLINPTFTVVHA